MLRSEPGKKRDREHLRQKGQQVRELQGSRGLVRLRTRRVSAVGAERGESSNEEAVGETGAGSLRAWEVMIARANIIATGSFQPGE